MRKLVALVALALALAVVASSPSAWADGDPTIGGQTTGQGISIDGSETTGGGNVSPAGSAPATRTITCDLTGAISAECAGAAASCMRPAPAPSVPVARVEEQQAPDGSWRQTGVTCNAYANDALAVTPDMVRQEVLRLLPTVPIGVAPADGPTLVNMETIFWAPTPAQRQLGPVSILGQPVAITIRFDHAAYDFGDGTSATTRSPGTPWSRAVCSTPQCPTLDGHTYLRAADRVTTRSTVSWTASFSVAGGAAQPIPGTVDGPTATHDLQVLEGRSVLVR